MEAVIMAAGRGSRLGNYTDNIPKSLLELSSNGLTILDYNLSLLSELDYISTIHIVTGYKYELIEEKCKQYPKCNVIYNPFWDNCNVLGSLFMALPYITEEFIFLHADTLMDKAGWYRLFVSDIGDIILPYERKICGEEEMKIIIDKGNITRISKEIDCNLAIGEFVGIAKMKYVAKEYFLEKSKKLFATYGLNLYMEAVLDHALANGDLQINGLDITGNDFVEIDFEEDYKKAIEIFGDI